MANTMDNEDKVEEEARKDRHEMSKLVSILQDSMVPAKTTRTTAPNLTAAQSNEFEKQFLIKSTDE